MGKIKLLYCLQILKQTLQYIFCLFYTWLNYCRFGGFRTYIHSLCTNNENLWTNQQNYKTILSHPGPWACGTWLTRLFCCFFTCILRILFKISKFKYVNLDDIIVYWNLVPLHICVLFFLKIVNVSSIIHLEDYMLVNIYLCEH